MATNKKYSTTQLVILVTARVMMGWYCLYEGIVKLMTPNWSSYAYLNDSIGIFTPLFKAISTNSNILSIIDFVNIWTLIAIGLGLFLGILTRISTMLAIILITMYYLSHPALINAQYIIPTLGNSMWVDKNIILIFSLLILLVFPTSHYIGIDRLIFRNKIK